MRPIKRVEKRTQGTDLVTKFTYDSRGNRTGIIDADSFWHAFSFDGLDRLVESQLPLSVTLTRTWDDDSLLLSEMDGLNHATTYTYDALGRVRRLATANNENYSYEYNPFNEITSVFDANGTEIDFLRDDLGRAIQKSVTTATGVSGPAAPEIFAYDALSNLVYAENDDAIVERTFDSRGLALGESLTFKSDSAEYTTTSGFDDAGNLTSIAYPGGRTVTHTFDALERLKVVSSNQSGTLGTYRYFGRSRVERRLNGDYSWMDFAFDDLGRTVGSLLRTVDGMAQNVLDSRSYGWDARHNRTSRVDTRAGGPETAFTYQHDGLSRLAQSTLTPGTGDPVNQLYSLDAAGNRNAVTTTIGQGTPVVEDYDLSGADALVNQYTVTPFDTARAYDANGNLTLRSLGLNSEVAFGYDYRNLMVSHTQTDPAQTAQYTYDALGRRIEKTVGEDTTRYVYHGDRVIEERDDTGTLLGSYVYGNYLDEVLSLRRGAANYFLHSDDQWNIVALTDADGDVVERYEYGDYGAPEFYDAAGNPLSGSTVGNPCLFTGQRFDAETGLYWYKSRYLDPQTGRFTTRDPLGLWGDPLNLGNPYTYTGNSPWTYLDPYGLCGEDDEADSGSAWDDLNSALDKLDDMLWDLLGLDDYWPDNLFGFKMPTPVEYTPEYGEGFSGYRQDWSLALGAADEAIKLAGVDLLEAGFAFARDAASGMAIGAAGRGLGRLSLIGDDAFNLARHGTGGGGGGGLRPYQVGPANVLQRLSRVGDDLAIHHAGQQHAMNQIVPGYDARTGPAIALPTNEHRAIPAVRGTYSGKPRSLLALDINNLRRYTNAPNRDLFDLIELNKWMYARAFRK